MISKKELNEQLNEDFEMLEEQFITNDTSITYANAWDFIPGYELPQNFQCAGVDNVGKFLKVGDDGYVRLTAVEPGTGVSEEYVDLHDQQTLQSANDYTLNLTNSAITTANGYTDQQMLIVQQEAIRLEGLIESLDATKAGINYVQASASGSSTDVVNYLTIGENEYKLPTGGGGGTSVIPSLQPVAGAKTIGSLNIDGQDWNAPQGGSFEQVQSDWTQTDNTQVDFIKNKPTLARVATTGNYSDLLNKPSIPGADQFLTKTGQNIAGGTYQFETNGFSDYNVRVERLNGDAGVLIAPTSIIATKTPDAPLADEYTSYERNIIRNKTANTYCDLIIPEKNGIKTLATLDDIPSTLSKQVILDMTHPINSTYVQYTADDDPNALFNKSGEYASTWTDITSTLHERFVQFDNGHSVGTLKEAGLPDITGRFSVGPKLQQTTATNVEALAVYNLGGCFSSFKNSSPVITDIDADYTRTGDEGYGNIVNFQASRSSSIYGRYSSSVMPKTYTVKLWKRTA